MSLIELKRLAKTKKIKQYYIMKKEDLINLLLMSELPFKFKLEKMTITELRQIAKDRGIRGFWSLSKEELTQKLFPSTQDEQQNNSQTCKHQNPQDQNSNQIWIHTSENPL
jgi:hypothetical protein